MAPYEPLYGRKCQSPLWWYEAGERSLLGPEMIAETMKQIKKIRSRMFIAQGHKKNYVDQRRKPLEFEEGEHVFLKVTPTTKVERAIKTKKLNPRYIRPFEILKRIGPVESVQVREDLTLPVTPVRIDDTSIKCLRGKEVSLVKVAWSQAGIEEHTWELELDIRKDYLHLFSGSNLLVELVGFGSLGLWVRLKCDVVELRNGGVEKIVVILLKVCYIDDYRYDELGWNEF
ncbi:uncharacterized protein [Arachis hypogaea]|uniref:uncharacterized protein n=1 Tax=Arachis hypogaea TaxID=3818 RepID=UPI000DEC6440|nr:uncharacterized protein LOC112742969 [Arachis hypogaea]